MLKTKTGLTFSENDILDSVHHIITTKGEFIKPKCPIEATKKKVVRKEVVPTFLTSPAVAIDGSEPVS
jgi:DNA replication initiation complex subunit (GINS family)